ncbi:hypothetical protein lerEdw1_018008 [Lerista edwardsae]|nr:hypothetical protein lerEdw1_018008 [Lerista edwardsae]
MGALESGVFGELPYEVEMLPPNERREDFCLIAECHTQVPKIMPKWRYFFKYRLSTTLNSESLSAAPSFSKDEALKYLWDVHVTSVAYSFPKFQNRLVVLTGPYIPTCAGEPAREPKDCDETPPPLWDLAPGNLREYSMQGNKIVIDAWNYIERMGLYKTMLNSTATNFAMLGPNNSGNILWGLPIYYGWEFITGMNYYLAIIPFLGALETGMFGELPYEVEMLPPNERRKDFCLSIAECNTLVPNLMSKWRHFFKYLSTTPNSRSLSAQSFSKDEALKYMWDAHDASNTYAFSEFQNR